MLIIWKTSKKKNNNTTTISKTPQWKCSFPLVTLVPTRGVTRVATKSQECPTNPRLNLSLVITSANSAKGAGDLRRKFLQLCPRPHHDMWEYAICHQNPLKTKHNIRAPIKIHKNPWHLWWNISKNKCQAVTHLWLTPCAPFYPGLPRSQPCSPAGRLGIALTQYFDQQELARTLYFLGVVQPIPKIAILWYIYLFIYSFIYLFIIINYTYYIILWVLMVNSVGYTRIIISDGTTAH